MAARTLNILPLRSALWLGLYSLILMAWWAVFSMAEMPGSSRWLTLFNMWSIMMAAMMLPTIIPMLQVYNQLPANTKNGNLGWLGIVIGYGVIWLAGAALFAGLQVFALRNALVDLSGVALSPWSAVILLLLAGIWQFSKTKDACQSACASPMQFYLTRWKQGFNGGISMGFEIGVTCVGCCWALMTLAFVGGVMNPLWMGVATAFMVLEKLPEIGMHLRRPAGVGLVIAGLVLGMQTIL